MKGIVPPSDTLIKNIYVRCWLSTNIGVRLKTQPNVLLVSETSPNSIPANQPLDFLPFPSIRPRNITVYFEVFGDFMKSQESSCYAFDQSLGIGTILIDKIAGNLSQQWIKLSYSTIGEKVVQLELLVSTKFTVQDDTKSFFMNKKENPRVKAPSLSQGSTSTTIGDRSPSRDSDEANKGRFSWTKKFTSVFSMNKPHRESNAKPDMVPEEVQQSNGQTPEENEQIHQQEEPNPQPSHENKSTKWRNSLALLTGELDLSDITSSDLPDTTGDEQARASLRRSVDSVLSVDSADQDSNSRSNSTDLTSLSPKIVNKKRLSVSEHPLGLGDILEEPHSVEVPPDAVEQNKSEPLQEEKKQSLVDAEPSPPILSTNMSPVEHPSYQLFSKPQEIEYPREGSITTEIAGSVKSEYENVQHISDIQSYLTKPYDKVGLGIFCNTPCEKCGHTFLDEEFLSSWGGFCDHPRDMTSDIYSSHMIVCPICKSDIIPKLHIRLYKLVAVDQSTAISDLVEETSKLECIWSTEIRHLSPFGVRLLTEHILEQEGFHIVEAEWMLSHHPDLYWNSMWYSIRLNLPNGFYSSKNLPTLLASIPSNSSQATTSMVWASTITISWRECVLESKILRILLDGHGEGILTLQNVFPQITKEDEILACEIINSMDGSVANVANSLKKINQLTSIWNIFTGTKGRKLYLTFLTLVHFYHPSCLLQHSTELPHGLSKVFFSSFLILFSLFNSLNSLGYPI